mgnify:CR=1 FL=1
MLVIFLPGFSPINKGEQDTICDQLEPLGIETYRHNWRHWADSNIAWNAEVETDIIAEKIRMLGAYAPTGISRMVELSAVEEVDNIPSPIGMFNELVTDNEKMIMQIKAGIVLADGANEPAISNFLQDLLDQHQKHAWFFKSIIK